MGCILDSEERVDLNETAKVGVRSGLNIAGIGRVYVWNGGSLWIGRGAGQTRLHAHHAIQITLAQNGPVRLRTRADADWSEYLGAVVRHNELHQFDGRGVGVAQIFVEPETAEGRALLAHQSAATILQLRNELAGELAQPLFARYAATKADAPMIAEAQAAIDRLAGSAPALAVVDTRIRRALDAMRRSLDGTPTLAAAAAVAHLSPSRFRHLFIEQMRTPFRTYVLWLRLNAAVESYSQGRNWTEAAHHAGFADSAHLSRTFRRMFGISPVMLIKE